jgi:hypothetical protein
MHWHRRLRHAFYVLTEQAADASKLSLESAAIGMLYSATSGPRQVHFRTGSESGAWSGLTASVFLVGPTARMRAPSTARDRGRTTGIVLADPRAHASIRVG